MKKKFLSYAMAASMVLTTIPSPALAAEDVPAEVQEKGDAAAQGEEEQQETQGEADPEEPVQEEQQEQSSDAIEFVVEGERVVPNADELPDQEELFAGYAMQQFYGDNGIATYGSMAGDRLEGLNKSIYDELKGKIAEVAAGELTSTEFAIPADLISGLSWTKEELGNIELVVSGQITEAAKAAVAEKFSAAVDTDKILHCLLADFPYELYWFDKTVGMSTPYQITGNSDGLSIPLLCRAKRMAKAAHGLGNRITRTFSKSPAMAIPLPLRRSRAEQRLLQRYTLPTKPKARQRRRKFL